MEKNHLSEFNFIKQPEDIQIICSACSLINALRLRHEEVFADKAQEICNEIIKTGTPLSFSRSKEIAQYYGYELKYLSQPEEETIGSQAEIIDYFTTQLRKYNPILLNISSKLSKRPSNSTDLHQQQLNNSLRGLLVVHSVVVCLQENTVYIIDPYEPDNPEIFDLDSETDMQRLSAWIASVAIEKCMLNKETQTSIDDDLETVIIEKLNNVPNKFFYWGCVFEANLAGLHQLKNS